MPPNLTFGQRLRIARRAAGLSIEEAASLFHRSSRLWKFWEADQRVPPVDADVITQEKLFGTLARAKAIQQSTEQFHGKATPTNKPRSH